MVNDAQVLVILVIVLGSAYLAGHQFYYSGMLSVKTLSPLKVQTKKGMYPWDSNYVPPRRKSMALTIEL